MLPQRHHCADGLLRVDGAHRRADRCREAPWVAVRAHDELERQRHRRSERLLGIRQVPDRPAHAEVEPVLLHVAHDADHRHPRPALACAHAPHPLAERVFGRPRLPPQLLAHHRDRQAALAISVVEQPPRDQFDPERRRVPRADQAVRRDRHLRRIGAGASLGLEDRIQRGPALHRHVRGRAGGNDPRKRSDAQQDLFDEAGALRQRRVPDRRKRQLDHHQSIGTKAQVDVLQALERPHQEPAADQERSGDRDFRDHQRGEDPPASAAARGALIPLPEHGDESGRTCDFQRRNHPGDRSGQDCHGERKREHPTVDPEIGEHRAEGRSLDRIQGGEKGPRPVREQHPGGAAEEGEQQAFGEELPDEAALRGAQRAPDGDLSFARHSTGEKQAGHVGATDEEEEPDGDGEDPQRPLRPAVDVREQLLPEGDDPVGPAAADLRVFLLEPARERLQLGIGILQSHAGLQARDELVPGRGAVGERERLETDLHRDPDFGRIRDVEPRGQHADDGVRPALQVQGTTDHVAGAAEVAMPQLVADERDGGSAGAVLVIGEEPAERGPDPQRTQIRRGDGGAVQPLGLDPAGQVELALGSEPGARERMRLVAVQSVIEERGTERIEAFAQSHAVHDVIHVGDRQRAQQQRIHRAEDGRVRAHPEPEREHRDDREAGPGAQHPPAVPQVPEEVAHRPLLSTDARRSCTSSGVPGSPPAENAGVTGMYARPRSPG